MAFGPFLLLALMEGMVTAAVLALSAAGLSLVFGVMRVVNVAHGEFFMLGAVIAWVVAAFVPGPPALAFVAALVIAPPLVGALAATADGLILKRLNYDPEATIVATIGLLYMIQQATLSLYGPNANPVTAPFEWRIQLPWFGYSGYKLFVIFAAVVVLLALWAFMTRTKAGLIMRATQIDRTTARTFGINVDRVYMGTFALGAGLAALAGVLVVPIQQAHYLMGGDPLLLSFIVVIIGGLGSLRGTLIAALVIVLVFRPQGLFGAKA
jgi:branched-chain amino acid transport system permease protein